MENCAARLRQRLALQSGDDRARESIVGPGGPHPLSRRAGAGRGGLDDPMNVGLPQHTAWSTLRQGSPRQAAYLDQST